MAKIELEPSVFLQFESVVRNRTDERRYDFVLLHGLTASYRNKIYMDWIPILQKYGSVYYFDLRGHGKSDIGKPSEYNLELLAEDIELIIKRLDLKNVILLGHSLGGLIIQKLFSRKEWKHITRQRISSLVFLSTFAAIDKEKNPFKKEHPLYALKYFVSEKYIREIVDEALAVDFRETNKEIRVPTLTISCLDDEMFIPPITPNNKKIQLESCGHSVRAVLRGFQNTEIISILDSYLMQLTLNNLSI